MNERIVGRMEYNLYRKTRHSYIYIYVAYSRPNGWADWAEFFCGNSWVGGVVIGKKKIEFFSTFIFFNFFWPRATQGPSASNE